MSSSKRAIAEALGVPGKLVCLSGGGAGPSGAMGTDGVPPNYANESAEMSSSKRVIAEALSVPRKLVCLSGGGARPSGAAGTDGVPPNYANEGTEGNSGKRVRFDRDYTRSVKLQWFVDFPWLMTDDSLLKCSVCVDAQKRNVFTTGKDVCKPKRDDLVKHEKTSDHKDAAARPQPTEVVRYECVRSAILAQMKTVLAQARSGIPISKNMALVELQVVNGVSVLKDLQNEEWLNHYPHSESINNIQQALAAVIKQELESKRRASLLKFYSIIVDEITDIVRKPVALVYVRFMAGDGDVETQFLGVVELANGDVADVFYAIKKILEDRGLVPEQMVALVVDGASAMFDVYRGVTARFKADLPHLIISHCLAHRLPLVVQKAAWGVPYLGKYESILRLLSRALKFSPQFMRLLKATLGLSEGEKFVKLQRVLLSERFCLPDCVQALADSLGIVMRCLTEALLQPDVEEKGSLESLVGKMSYRFVMMTQFLADASGVMEVLTASMRCKGVTYVQLMSQFNAAQLAVRNLLRNPAQHVKRTKEELPLEPGESGFSSYCGHNIKDSPAERDKFQESANVLIADLGVRLETMFPESDLICGFSALSPRAGDAGEAQLSTLVNHFPGFVDGPTALLEWSLLKQVIGLEQHKSLDLSDFFSQFIHENLQAYPNLGFVAAVGVALPVRTPECEHGVAAFTVAAVDIENILLADIEDIMTLAIHAKSLDAFNFDAAFKVWTTAMDRRRYEELENWKIEKSEDAVS